MSDERVFTSNDASIFVQKQTGGKYYYLGECTGIDDLPNSLVGYDPIICTKEGNLAVIGKKQTAPSLPEFTVENLLRSSANWLDLMAASGCPFNLFVLIACNEIGVFDNNAERAYLAQQVHVIEESAPDLLQRENDDEIVVSRSMNFIPPRISTWEIRSSQKTTAETTDINTITATPGACLGECGDQKELCEELWAGCDAVASATANLLRSQDGGVTWAATAADPFAVDENIFTVRTLRIDNDSVRVIVGRDADAANPLETAYSDDYGATWTMVVLGATNNEGFTNDAQLFVLNTSNIWACTDAGNVYYSNDSGLTFTVQSSALAASGANALNSIKFINDRIGYAVGDADTIIYTLDGGVNWVAATATGGGNALLDIVVFSQYHVLVCDDGGQLWVSYDQAATWTERTDFLGTGTGSLQNMKMNNDLVLFMVQVDGSGNGHLLRSLNGGYSFTRIAGYSASAGYNAVHVCNDNHAFVVGEDDGATGVIVEAGRSTP